MVWTRQLTKSDAVTVGNHAILEAEVSISDRTSIWMKDGQQIRDDGNKRVYRKGGIHRLKVKDVSVKDEGKYCLLVDHLFTTVTLHVQGEDALWCT